MGRRKDPNEIVTKVIYRLRNPINQKIFYVGYGEGDGTDRFKCHTGPSCHSMRLIEYIYNLKQKGRTPLFEVVDSITGTIAQVLALETKWIHAMEAIYGEEMCNVTNSSLKKRRPISAETRRIVRETLNWKRRPEPTQPNIVLSDAQRFTKWMEEQINPKRKPTSKKKRPGGRYPASATIPEKYSQCKYAADRYAWMEREEERARAKGLIP